ncbi:unnamed protein product [Urochloa decumbens]|uniref:DUF1618 domain-containing protein n=1 Tax=Urochloa decumbens TaxID=240449 RepID=A0ABC9CQN8_9POAL
MAAAGSLRGSRAPVAADDPLASRAPPLAGRGSPPSSVAMSADADFPKWVLLETYVFRRDDDESFPDENDAPIRASGTTTWGADFRIAFAVAKPPRISRLYAQLPQPGFLGPDEGNPLAMLATHRHLALFRVGTYPPTRLLLQNFFIYSSADNGLLKMLPPCREPSFDYTRPNGRRPTHPKAPPRLLNTSSLGLWCGLGEDFVVVELSLYIPSNRLTVFADICLLRSSCTPGRQLGGRWESMRVEILSGDDPDEHELWQLSCWRTETIIPFGQWLCWVDYNRGILFCDMSELQGPPTISFLMFPVDKFPLTSNRIGTWSSRYRGVSVVSHGRELKFVNVTRQDDIPLGALKPGTGFTITCHTLDVLGWCSGMRLPWKVDYKVTSDELWHTNPQLPPNILMFPRVDIDRPDVVHFLYIEFGYANKNMWTVSIDMSTKAAESFSVYIDRKDSPRSDDGDFTMKKSMSPWPFLPCEFPEFLHLSSLAGRGGDETSGAIMCKKEEKNMPRKYIQIGSMPVEICWPN